MDPHANISEQRELAREILSRLDRPGRTLRSVTDGHVEFDIADAAERLAGLVQALDERRRKGGFDPYGSAHT